MLDPVSIPFLVCVALQVARAAFPRRKAESVSEGEDASSAEDGVVGAVLGFGAGVAGNFTHEFAKGAWQRISDRLSRGSTPANHDIMRAVRRATLRAGLAFSQQWWLHLKDGSVPDPEWRRNLDVWIHSELDRVDAPDYDLPTSASSQEVELLFRPSGADPNVLAELQSRLTQTFLAELQEHTRSGRIPVAEQQVFNSILPQEFARMLSNGCVFRVPDPGLLKQAADLLNRDVNRLFSVQTAPSATPAPPVTFFAAICEYFVEDFKSNQRLHSILDAQLLLDLKYGGRGTPAAAERDRLEHALRGLLEAALREFAGTLDTQLKALEQQQRALQDGLRQLTVDTEEQFRTLHEVLNAWTPYLAQLPGLAGRLDELRYWLEGFRAENRQLHSETHRLLRQVLHQCAHGVPAAVAAHALLAALPPRPPCFGRQPLVEDLAQLVLMRGSGPRAIVVSGTGGLGKSNLLKNLLHHPRIVARFADRRLFVDCSGAKSMESLLFKLADAFGLPTDSPALAAEVRRLLREAPITLVLDNAETPLDSDPGRVRELLGQLAGERQVSLLLGRRGRTNIPGLEGVLHFDRLRKLTPAAARAWFLACALPHLDRGDGTLEPDYSCDPHLDDLLRELDGHPLSLLLVAAYAATGREPALRDVCRRWKEHDLSAAQQGLEGDKDQNLLASFALSFDRLRPEARRLVRLLALLPDGMARTTAAELLGMSRGDPAGDLLRAELVEPPGQERLTMLAPLRECARQAPVGQDENPEQIYSDRTRLFHHFLGAFIPLRVSTTPCDWPTLIARMESELGNLEALFDTLFKESFDQKWFDAALGYGWLAARERAKGSDLDI